MTAIIYFMLVLGIILMVFGIVYGVKLLSIVKKKGLRIQLTISLILTCFFLLGYAGYLYNLIVGNTLSFTPVLISAIFCFGAGFVVLVLNVVYESFQGKKQRVRK